MAIIIFIYEKNIFKKIFEDRNELIIKILLEYSSNINKNLNELYFICKGKKLLFKNKEKINIFKNNIIIINVFNLNTKKESKKFRQIICPKCKELVIINIDGDKVSVSNCINKHNIKDLSIKDFMKNQYIKELKCYICKNDKYLYNNKLYICSCNKYICLLKRMTKNII